MTSDQWIESVLPIVNEISEERGCGFAAEVNELGAVIIRHESIGEGMLCATPFWEDARDAIVCQMINEDGIVKFDSDVHYCIDNVSAKQAAVIYVDEMMHVLSQIS